MFFKLIYFLFILLIYLYKVFKCNNDIFRSRTIKNTTLESVLLGFVFLHEFSGYDIKKIFDKSYILRWSASPGSIYPALKRLVEKKYLQPKKIIDSKIPKDVYYLTEEGKKSLKEWVKTPFKSTEIVRYGIELKILFLHVLTYKEKIKFLDEQIQEILLCIDDLPKWKRTLNIKNKYRDFLYEEKLREFKNYIRMLEELK